MRYDDGPGLPVRLISPAVLHEPVAELARRCGLAPADRAEVGLLLATGELSDVADQWMAQSLPHLVICPSAGGVRLGPFVSPGLTACVRCVAAGRGLLTTVPVEAAYPETLEPALLTLALGWAARDLQAWSAGREPATWSTTIHLGTDPLPVSRRWLRHPHCGCSWFDAW